MNKKITFSLFLMAFSLSSFLSIVGIIGEISKYFNVSLTMAGLFVSLFALILAVTGLFLPSYFSSFERKKFFIATLSIFIVSSFLQIFIKDFYLALIVRLIPAFFYSSAISIALTMMSEISKKDVNKVILGVSSGTILGLSISTHIGLEFGYSAVNVWIFIINVLALIGIMALLPKMKGHKRKILTQIDCAKTKKFIVSVIFILFIGVAISVVYNYFTIILLDLTKIHNEAICIFLFANGIASMVGTSFFGYLINKKNNLAILVYPIVFMIVVFLLGMEIKISAITFILLIAFGLLDGSMHTIAQFWISSSIKKAPEFANGVYLFINNLNRSIGIYIGGLLIEYHFYYSVFAVSMVLFLFAIPFVLYRLNIDPSLRKSGKITISFRRFISSQ